MFKAFFLLITLFLSSQLFAADTPAVALAQRVVGQWSGLGMFGKFLNSIIEKVEIQ